MKDSVRHPTPISPELGTHDGLAYALFLPDDEPDVGVVILHGAGSAKESHFDFARGCRADGMAALAFDDALAMAGLLRAYVPKVALRGSSMGGFQAIHTAAQAREEGDPVAAVVAICPAPEAGLLRFLRSGQRIEFDCDAEACEPWLESLDTLEAAGRLGPDTALLLMHARGDEQVPHAVSEQVYEAAAEPKRVLLVPGGHHRSVQHDEELQAVARKFIRDAARRG